MTNCRVKKGETLIWLSLSEKQKSLDENCSFNIQIFHSYYFMSNDHIYILSSKEISRAIEKIQTFSDVHVNHTYVINERSQKQKLSISLEMVVNEITFRSLTTEKNIANKIPCLLSHTCCLELSFE